MDEPPSGPAMDERPSGPVSSPGLPPAPRRRLPVLMIAGAVAVALIVGGSVYALTRPDEAVGPVNPTGPSPAPSASEEPAASLATPSGLVADASSFKVTLTWVVVPEATGYEVSRDGSVLGSVSTAEFVDDEALPEQTYEYEVVAENDQASSAPASLEVQTDGASPGLARLDGVFNVRVRERSHFGLALGKGGNRFTAAWGFKPRCAHGACSVRWVDRSTRGLSADLNRSGATYRGSRFGRFGGTCGGTRTTATVMVTIRVVEATVRGDEWRASKLEGTLTSRSAAQLGCVRAGIDYTFTAKLV